MPEYKKEAIASYVVAMGGQAWLAKLISRQFGLTYRESYRIVSIGSWAAYLAGRNAAGGAEAATKYSQNLKAWNEEFKKNA